jgi:hypothetical protein
MKGTIIKMKDTILKIKGTIMQMKGTITKKRATMIKRMVSLRRVGTQKYKKSIKIFHYKGRMSTLTRSCSQVQAKMADYDVFLKITDQIKVLTTKNPRLLTRRVFKDYFHPIMIRDHGFIFPIKDDV